MQVTAEEIVQTPLCGRKHPLHVGTRRVGTGAATKSSNSTTRDERSSRWQRRQSERCARDPRPELRRTYELLGLDAGFAPTGLSDVVHAARGERVAMTPGVRRQLAELSADDAPGLFAAFPELDAQWWPNLVGQLR